MRWGSALLFLLPVAALAAKPASPPIVREPAAAEDEFEWSGQNALSDEPDQPAVANPSPGSFKKPAGPPQGGTVRVPHPDAAKGLLRINKDGSYQYKTTLRPKSQAMSVRVMMMTPPTISGPNGATFKSIYGSGSLYSLAVDYEWDPFKSFGALGVQLGTGIATAHGNGVLTGYAGNSTAQETYNIFIVPLSAYAIYRFEYVRRQWVVPFVNGGVTYYGMAEKRDDDKPVKFAGAPAIGGGGGVHLSISRLDQAKAFVLDREYGVADMWLTLEGRVVQGLYSDTDFSSEMVSVGVTVDF